MTYSEIPNSDCIETSYFISQKPDGKCCASIECADNFPPQLLDSVPPYQTFARHPVSGFPTVLSPREFCSDTSWLAPPPLLGLRAPFAQQIVTTLRDTTGPELSRALLMTSSQPPFFILQPVGRGRLPLGTDAQWGREWPELAFLP